MKESRRYGYPLQARVAARALRHETVMPGYFAIALLVLMVAGQIS